MSIQAKVALAHDFLSDLSKLPSNVHSKILKWVVTFQTNPTAAGINYEKIHQSRDSNLRSIRIDQDYRGIVLKPEKEDLFVLLHVDHHDAAYQWAARRSLKINPFTGALQILVTSEETIQTVSENSETLPEKNNSSTALLFPHVSKNDLVYFGVPEELIEQTWKFTSTAELNLIASEVGNATFEALSLLAVGFSVDDVKEDFERPSVQKVNVNDFTSALEVDDSRSRFYVVDNEKELTSILNAPLSQWRIFLHPKQRKLATSDFNGPARILGGAGTGKTVLAMHRARWLAETRTSEGDKILFTTFSRNLAGDIHSNLETLCTKETLAKIEVINLDRWVHGYLQKHRYPHRICYSFDEDEVKRAWGRSYGIKSDAVDLDEGFYKLEWEQVIAAQGITTLDEYRMARRQGRGTLRRPARDAVWPVFEEFRAQLTSRKLKMVDDAYRDAAALLKSDDSCQKYTSIIVDETQDFGPMALRLIRSLVKEGRNDLFFVGDGHQRIYNRNRAAMSKCGINIVGRSKKLHLNYRTTEEIRSYATSLLEGVSVDDLDDGVDTNKGYISLSHGAAPNVQHVESVDDALNRAVQIATKQSDISKTHCIIAPSNLLCDQLKQMLERTNIEAMIVTPDGRDKSESLAVRISTMHRAKGLEFDKVTVMAKKSVLELPVQDETERKLVYVSLTRAKREAALIVY